MNSLKNRRCHRRYKDKSSQKSEPQKRSHHRNHRQIADVLFISSKKEVFALDFAQQSELRIRLQPANDASHCEKL